MIDKITLKNFRCFKEAQEARLAPLTLLVGENSTGKTSFMAMIRALWDVAYRHRTPNFKEEPYDLGSFDEIAHHRGARGSRADKFEAGFSSTDYTGQSSCFNMIFGKHGITPILMQRRFTDRNKGIWIEERSKRGNQDWKFIVGTERGSWEYRNRNLPEDSQLLMEDRKLSTDQRAMTFIFGDFALIGATASDFQSLNVSPDFTGEELDKLCDVLNSYFSKRILERPYAGAPVRSKPKRTYDPARPPRDPEGDYVPMYLASVYFQDKERWEKLRDSLDKFGEASGLFDEITIKQLGGKESEPFQVQVRKFGSKRNLKGPMRNLIDVGYGVSQILPVITELLRETKAPSMFLLQQPEVHLHPMAQAALGSLFCQIASPDRQLVVETHSDHLLGRVRMDVRDKKTRLKPDDVSILFFERNELDVSIHSIRLDEEGNVKGAPDSYGKFFMEEMARSLRLE